MTSPSGRETVLQVVGAGLMAGVCGEPEDDDVLGAFSDPSVVSGGTLVRRECEDGGEKPVTECSACEQTDQCKHVKKGTKTLTENPPCRLMLRHETTLCETKPEDSAQKTEWKNKRSMTTAEVHELKDKKAAHGCGKGYVEGKGYAVYTHRARSKYYPSPEAIPEKVLKFISSTG